MKSLRLLIVACIIGLSFCGSVLFYLVAEEFSNRTLEKTLENTFNSLSFTVSERIKELNEKEFNMIRSLASLDYMRNPENDFYEKQRQLDRVTDTKPNYIGISFTDEKGNSFKRETNSIINFSERTYFKAAINGKEYINPPMINKITNGLTMFYSTPVKNDGGKVTNVIFSAMKGEVLCDICENAKIGKKGHPIIIDRTSGIIIGDINRKNVEDMVDMRSRATESESLRSLIVDAFAGNSGFGIINLNGEKQVISYCSVAKTDWTVMVEAPYSDFTGPLMTMRYVMIITSVILMVIGVFIALLVGRILTPLNKVGNAINEIASGNADLTKRLEMKVNYREISSVSDGFNAFIEKLHVIISAIKSSKNDLSKAGDDLSAGTDDTEASIKEILASIDSVQAQISIQSGSVHETAGAVNQIAGNIEALEKMIDNQSSGVNRASSSVEEMVANIKEVNSNVELMANSFQELEMNAQNGVKTQRDVSEKIKSIEEQSKMLQEANSTISNIAAQTNLLAMNAAIEAAHAGEAGKGFSVVADEIRKLSETSTAQSKTIGDELNKIKESIASVVLASDEANRNFETMSSSIKKTDGLVQSIKGAMEEQSVGSKEIIEVLRDMTDSTSEVKCASVEMSEGNKQILEQVRNLQDATGNIQDTMREISVSARKIGETGTALGGVSRQMTDSIAKIGKEIDEFHV